MADGKRHLLESEVRLPAHGRWNFVFGDGSVRYLRFGVDKTQFWRACLISDGEVLNLD